MSKAIKVVGDAAELDQYFPEMKEAGGGYYHSAWSSPEAFGKHIATLNRKDAWESAGWRKDDEGFYGTDSMEEATQIAKDGWKEGAEQAIRVRDRILAAYPPQKRPVRYGIAGTTPNIPRAVAGDVLNMRLPDESKSKRRPVLTLISNMAGLCYIDPNALSNRAAVVAALVDQIEAAGYAVEVLSTAYGSNHSKSFMKAVTVVAKKSDQPVDMPRLSFALGHASMFRRFVFAELGSDPVLEKNLGWGLGRTREMDPKSIENMDIYFLPSANGRQEYFKTEEAAQEQGRKYLIECLTKQKCPAFFDRKKFTDDEKESLLTEEGKKDPFGDDPW